MSGPRPKVVLRLSKSFPCRHCQALVYFGKRVKDWDAPQVLANDADNVLHSVDCEGYRAVRQAMRSKRNGVLGEAPAVPGDAGTRKTFSTCERCGHKNVLSVKAFMRRSRPKCITCGEPLLPSARHDAIIRKRIAARGTFKPR